MSETIRNGDFLIVAIPYDDCGGEEPEMSAEIEFGDIVKALPLWLACRIEYRGVERKESRRDS